MDRGMDNWSVRKRDVRCYAAEVYGTDDNNGDVDGEGNGNDDRGNHGYNVDEISDDGDDGDSDYHEDEHKIQDVEVDMRDFFMHVDRDVEWGGVDEEVNDVQQQPPDQCTNLNFDHFDSLSSSEGEDQQGPSRSKKKKKVRYPQFNRGTDLRNVQFFVGQEFGTKSDVIAAIKQYSIQTRRAIKISKNDNVRVRVICKGNLPGSKDENVNENDEDTENGVETVNEFGNDPNTEDENDENVVKPCPWVLLISRPKVGGTWQVKTLKDEHICLQTRQIKACTARFLAKALEEQVRTNPGIPVSAIQDQFQMKLELDVSRMKAFRAKCMASNMIIGNYAQQYSMLRDYALELTRANPGTTIKIEVESCPNAADPYRIFKRIYICLGPLKEGFRAGCRGILCLDGTFIKGPYPGQLLTAVGIDPNNGIYPLAYAIVEAETYNSWAWFLECIGSDLDLYANSNFTFMSDRQKGLIPALARIFPCAEHRFCLRHIWTNFKQEHKGKEFKDFLWSAATATTVGQFQKVMEELKKREQKAFNYLNAIGAHHWTRSHFTGISKCDVLYNNVCESFNKQLVDGRDKPVVTCLEFVREYLMQRIVLVQKEIKKCHGPLCPAPQATLDNIKKHAALYKALWNGGDLYQVGGPNRDQCVVDLKKRSCTCRKWELSAIPCKHAVSAIWVHGQNGGNGIPETWVDKAYKLDTWKKIYMHKVNPINGPSVWPRSDCPSTLKPPHHRKQIGRPAKKRRKEPDENPSGSQARSQQSDASTTGQGHKMGRASVSLHCTKCRNPGHNARTCDGRGGESQKLPVKRKKTSGSSQTETASRGETHKEPVKRKNAAGAFQIETAAQARVQTSHTGGSHTPPQVASQGNQARDSNVVLLRGLLFSTQPRVTREKPKDNMGTSCSQP